MKERRTRLFLTLIAIIVGGMQLFAQSDHIVKEYRPISYRATFDLIGLDDSSNIMEKPKSLMLLNTCTLPLFCAIEHAMEVKSTIPIRIRIGNLDYVNQLEGK